MITRAAAEIAVDGVAYVRLAGVGVFGKEGGRAHDHAGRAVAALEAVLDAEAFLHGIELVAFGDAFDGRELLAIGLDGQDGAGLDGFAIERDGAGAALGGVAADMR